MQELRGYRISLSYSGNCYEVQRIWAEGSIVVDHETVLRVNGKNEATKTMQELNTALALKVGTRRTGN